MQNFGIYIHIPFCQRKCKYCDFISFDKCDETIKEKYIQSILKEIENCQIRRKVSTIYIGGGTPSVLPARNIQEILEKIQEKFDFAENIEITIEVNPGTVDLQKLEMYKKAGINRLSIGLQTTQNRLLDLLGRIHQYEDFVKAYHEARNVRIYEY